MTPNTLAGCTILVIEDEPLILLDVTRALEDAGARVLWGSQHSQNSHLSGAVLDRAEATVADRLVGWDVPLVFYTGREPDEFARWPQAPVLTKPASANAIVKSLVGLIRSQGGDMARQPDALAPRDLLITDALRERRTKSNSSAKQVRAFHELSGLVLRNPKAALQRFLSLAVELCEAGSAGWSRLGHNGASEEVFWWDDRNTTRGVGLWG